MPIIKYECSCGNVLKKFFRRPKEAPVDFSCGKCALAAKRTLSAPNSTSVLVVDNGLQARSTEVNLEIVESIQERSTKTFTED